LVQYQPSRYYTQKGQITFWIIFSFLFFQGQKLIIDMKSLESVQENLIFFVNKYNNNFFDKFFKNYIIISTNFLQIIHKNIFYLNES
jgi:hypothetical protein